MIDSCYAHSMKLIIAVIILSISTISHSQEQNPEPDPPKRGEVIQIVPHPSYLKKTGKTTVLVWDGKKNVKVSVATHYLGKVKEGEIFPYKIKRDRKGQFVSTNRKGL